MNLLGWPNGRGAVLMRGHEETTKAQVPALRSVISTRLAESTSSGGLFGGGMPEGSTAGEHGALATAVGEPGLLSGQGKRGAGAGVAPGASGIREKEGFGVTKGLKVATH